MWDHITVIRWAVQITPETFQEASACMNEGLCPVQTLHLHMCITVAVQSVILIPYIALERSHDTDCAPSWRPVTQIIVTG